MRVRCVWHFVAGFIAGFVGAWCWGAPIAGTMAFVSYEVWQDTQKHTTSYMDIWEFCVGLFIGLVSIIPIKVLGVA